MCDEAFYSKIHSSLDRSETLQRKGSNHLQQLPVFWGGFWKSPKRQTTEEEVNLIKLHQWRTDLPAVPPPVLYLEHET